jgi:hypothetical protein
MQLPGRSEWLEVMDNAPYLVQFIELANLEENNCIPVFALDGPILLLGFCAGVQASQKHHHKTLKLQV